MNITLNLDNSLDIWWKWSWAKLCCCLWSLGMSILYEVTDEPFDRIAQHTFELRIIIHNDSNYSNIGQESASTTNQRLSCPAKLSCSHRPRSSTELLSPLCVRNLMLPSSFSMNLSTLWTIGMVLPSILNTTISPTLMSSSW